MFSSLYTHTHNGGDTHRVESEVSFWALIGSVFASYGPLRLPGRRLRVFSLMVNNNMLTKQKPKKNRNKGKIIPCIRLSLSLSLFRSFHFRKRFVVRSSVNKNRHSRPVVLSAIASFRENIYNIMRRTGRGKKSNNKKEIYVELRKKKKKS